MENQEYHASAQRTYTVEQVAQILGVSVRTAYYLCEEATQFRVLRLGKRCIRVNKESFDQWFNGGNGAS